MSRPRNPVTEVTRKAQHRWNRAHKEWFREYYKRYYQENKQWYLPRISEKRREAALLRRMAKKGKIPLLAEAPGPGSTEAVLQMRRQAGELSTLLTKEKENPGYVRKRRRLRR